MAWSNIKKIVSGSDLISSDFGSFFTSWNKMRIINKIKKSHDYQWYNEYLKTSKKFKDIFIQYCGEDDVSVIPFEDLACDEDMITLYLCEIYISHNVTSKIDKNERVYIIQLTNEYFGL